MNRGIVSISQDGSESRYLRFGNFIGKMKLRTSLRKIFLVSFVHEVYYLLFQYANKKMGLYMLPPIRDRISSAEPPNYWNFPDSTAAGRDVEFELFWNPKSSLICLRLIRAIHIRLPRIFSHIMGIRSFGSDQFGGFNDEEFQRRRCEVEVASD